MPRNSSGTMSAPAGQPAVAGTVISSATFNSLVADLVAELTDSASRSGKGAFSAPVKTPDGSAASPAHTFSSEATGFFRSAAGELAVSILGALASKLTAAGFEISVASPVIKATGTNAQLNIQGNRAGADANDEIVLVSTATRTAGYLLGIWSNASVPVKKLAVDYQGLLQLVNTGAIQPASVLTAVTPATNISASASYWKDATGTVHVQGSVAGSGATIVHGTLLFNLPAGFRPDSTRAFATLDTSKNVFGVQVASTGDVTLIAPVSVTSAGSTNLANGGPGLFLDVIAFLARG